MSRLVSGVVALVVSAQLLGCAGARFATTSPEDQASLSALGQRFLDERLARDPVWASEVDVRSRDRELGRYGPADRVAALQALDAFVAELDRSFDPSRLGAEAQAEREVLRYRAVADARALREKRAWESDPSRWLTEASRSISSLLNGRRPVGEATMAVVTARLEHWPELFAAARLSLVRPPLPWTEAAIAEVDAVNQLLSRAIPQTFAEVEDVARQGGLREAMAGARDALIGYTFFLRDEVLPRSNGPLVLEAAAFDALLREEGIAMPAASLWTWSESEKERARAKVASTTREHDAQKTPAQVLKALRASSAHEPLAPSGRLERARAALRSEVRRRFGARTVEEGWALYEARITADAGASAPSRALEADQELLALTRLRAALRLHAAGGSLAETIELFEKEALLSHDAAEHEALACSRDPLCGAAALGLRELSSLRASAEKRAGDSFSVESFHDALLAYGAPRFSWLRATLELPEKR